MAPRRAEVKPMIPKLNLKAKQMILEQGPDRETNVTGANADLK